MIMMFYSQTSYLQIVYHTKIHIQTKMPLHSTERCVIKVSKVIRELWLKEYTFSSIWFYPGMITAKGYGPLKLISYEAGFFKSILEEIEFINSKSSLKVIDKLDLRCIHMCNLERYLTVAMWNKIYFVVLLGCRHSYLGLTWVIL